MDARPHEADRNRATSRIDIVATCHRGLEISVS